MEYTLFIFRRDLRLVDNKGLIYAIENFDNIIPIFIFTPEQITDKNKYKSNNCIQFMIESLIELNDELKKYKSKIHFFYGDNTKVLKKIIKTINVINIVFNKDYTLYAQKRDKDIEKLCKKKNINCVMTEDYLLMPIGTFDKKDGEPYTVFTPFKNNGLKQKVDQAKKIKIKNLTKTNKLDESGIVEYEINDNIAVNGGRNNALKILKKIKNFNKYNKERNTLKIPTTMLSAYIKFGCVSIREVYWKLKEEFGTKNDLIGQLFWREMYYYVAYYFPKVQKSNSFIEKYDKIKWKWSKKNYDAWCNGETGFPVVDACMNELNTTGFMHNRGRLITSNFLNRMLGTDWRHGEKYFAQKLVDYDPIVNNNNWMWVSSAGIDPKPYFQRLFNPILQAQKFDPDAEYIKKWLPNLKNIPAKHLLDWEKHHHEYDLKSINYVKPIINYEEARQESIKMFKKVL